MQPAPNPDAEKAFNQFAVCSSGITGRLLSAQLAKGTRLGAPQLDGGTVGNRCRGHATVLTAGIGERPCVRLSEEIVHVRTLEREAPSYVAAGF